MPAIVIRDCSECVDMDSRRVYTADSFENVFSWICKKENKTIKKYLEGNYINPPIPDWCPRRK